MRRTIWRTFSGTATLALTIWSAHASLGQDKESPLDLVLSIERTARKLSNEGPEVKGKADTLGKGTSEIARAAGRLAEVINKVSEGEVGRKYSLSLRGDLMELARLGLNLQNENCGEDAIAEDRKIETTLAAIQKSLEAKTYHASGEADPLVHVTVRTKHDVEVSGLEVWSVPRALEHQSRYHSRFAQLSSPTDDDLAPGRYYFFSKDGGKKGELVPLAIGGPKREKMRIDIPTP